MRLGRVTGETGLLKARLDNMAAKKRKRRRYLAQRPPLLELLELILDTVLCVSQETPSRTYCNVALLQKSKTIEKSQLTSGFLMYAEGAIDFQ
jgi:hypothetical protein